MTRKDIDNIISIICPNDEDFEKPIISPAYLKKELESLALEQEPSGDLISRDKVHEIIAVALSEYITDEERETLETLDVDVANIPTVQYPKTGHWIKQTLSVKPFGEDTVLCNQCAFMTDKDNNYNYCPNCGAKMVEKPRVRIGNNTYYY